MTVTPYRLVLALPGVARLTVVTGLARIPVTAIALLLTLHVVVGLDKGYGPAGVVGGVATIGTAIGAPILGRVVDQYGLRRMLLVTTIAQGLFWSAVPWLSYPVLLGAAFFGGMLTLPVFSVARQSLAALVPEAQRRAAYSIDSMSVELSFMVGPLAAVAVATQFSTTVALLANGALIVGAGVALFVFNPPVKSDAARDAVRPPVRAWLRPALVSVLVATAGATLVLAGTDVGIVAALQSSGQVSWVGVVLAAWALVSLVGGFVYGVLRRGVSSLVLAAALGVCTVPVGLFGGSWWVLCLTIVPAGLLCAPTLTALTDELSRLTPETVRGLVMGVQGSAFTVGFAIGAPLAGSVVDASAPKWAFAVVGVAGAAVALAALAVRRIWPPDAARPEATPDATPDAATPESGQPAAAPVDSSVATTSAIS